MVSIFEHAGQTPRRKGDLEVVTARVGIEVEHLAGEIEPLTFKATHRIGIHLLATQHAILPS